MFIVVWTLLLIAIVIFAMAQNAYYSKKMQWLLLTHEHDLLNAQSLGRLEALNDPQAVLTAYHKMFTYTMN